MSPWRIAAFNSLVTILMVGSVAAQADERLAGKACRSVHLGYPAGAGTAFYNEVTVEKSARGTYFAVCGWNKGYYGIQELANGRKLLLFSVWDSGQNDPQAVDEGRRVKLLHQGEGVRIGRFGGEGSGGQSFFDYDWKAGETYRFLVTATSDGDRTAYAGWFFVPEENAWKHLVTFSTITAANGAGGRPLGGYYSFVEDFKRDVKSAAQPRIAEFGGGWVRGIEGRWTPLTRARFTADSNPATNIDAAVVGDRFRLATGGDTANAGAKLGATLERPKKEDAVPPPDLPATGSDSDGVPR